MSSPGSPPAVLSSLAKIFLLVVVMTAGCARSSSKTEENEPDAGGVTKTSNSQAADVDSQLRASDNGDSAKPQVKNDPYAPPSDAQVIRDATENGKNILKVKLSQRPGKKSWNSIHGQYFWQRGLIIIKKSSQFGADSDITCEIGGFARYEITGGRYSYREFKTQWVEYQGIPRPSDEEVLKLVNSKLPDFLRGHSSTMVHLDKLKIEIAGADQQKYVWHNPTSLSMNLLVTCDRKVSNTEIVSEKAIWELRMYRNDKDAPWDRLISSRKTSEELAKVKLPIEEVRAMETLSTIFARQAQSEK